MEFDISFPKIPQMTHSHCVDTTDDSFTLCCLGFMKYLISNAICFSSLFQKIVEMAQTHDALVMVDNSIMSPVLSCPIELGAGIWVFIDVVVLCYKYAWDTETVSSSTVRS